MYLIIRSMFLKKPKINWVKLLGIWIYKIFFEISNYEKMREENSDHLSLLFVYMKMLITYNNNNLYYKGVYKGLK